MATANYSISNADGWVEVADTTDDFIIEVRDPNVTVKVTLQASAPAADAAFHSVTRNNSFIRAGTTGKAYVAITDPLASDVIVIVSI